MLIRKAIFKLYNHVIGFYTDFLRTIFMKMDMENVHEFSKCKSKLQNYRE